MPPLLGLATYRGGLVLVAGLVAVIAACNGNSISVSSAADAGSVARPSLTQGPAAETAGPCPLTLGAEGVLPPTSVEPNPSVLPVPWVDQWYGNEAIWIRLPTDGVLPAQPDPAATDHDTDTLYTASVVDYDVLPRRAAILFGAIVVPLEAVVALSLLTGIQAKPGGAASDRSRQSPLPPTTRGTTCVASARGGHHRVWSAASRVSAAALAEHDLLSPSSPPYCRVWRSRSRS